MTNIHWGGPSGVTPVILLVAGPDEIDAVRTQFEARYAVDYDLRCAVSADEAERLTRLLVDADVPIAMFAIAPELPDSSFDDALEDLQRLCPTARRVCVVVSKEWFSGGVARLRDAVSDGVIDAYLGNPRGPRDEEFHTALAELLSEWGWSAHGPEVEGVQIVANDVLGRPGADEGHLPADGHRLPQVPSRFRGGT